MRICKWETAIENLRLKAMQELHCSRLALEHLLSRRAPLTTQTASNFKQSRISSWRSGRAVQGAGFRILSDLSGVGSNPTFVNATLFFCCFFFFSQPQTQVDHLCWWSRGLGVENKRPKNEKTRFFRLFSNAQKARNSQLFFLLFLANYERISHYDDFHCLF